MKPIVNNKNLLNETIDHSISKCFTTKVNTPFILIPQPLTSTITYKPLKTSMLRWSYAYITIFMFLRELWSLKTLHERNQDVLVSVNSIRWLQTLASCEITCQKSISPSRTHLHKPHHSPVGRALASLASTPSTNWPPKTCALVQSIISHCIIQCLLIHKLNNFFVGRYSWMCIYIFTIEYV
jgi:hypothetical protein